MRERESERARQIYGERVCVEGKKSRSEVVRERVTGSGGRNAWLGAAGDVIEWAERVQPPLIE